MSRDLGLDPRWVRYDLKAVGDWAARNGGRLIRQRGRGVRLEGVTPESLGEARLPEEAGVPQVGYEYVLSPKERQQVILTRLLTQTAWTRIQELAAKLFVSRATVHKDLDELGPWLGGRGLHLERRANAGVALTGPEEAWRRIMCDVLSEVLDTSRLARFLEEGSDPSWDHGWAGDLATAGEISAVARAARRAGEILRLQVADGAFLRLVIWLSVTIERLSGGHGLPLGAKGGGSTETARNRQVAATIAAEVEVATGVALPEAEVAALAAYLEGFPLWVEDARPTAGAEGAEELALATALASKAGVLLGVPLWEDQELVLALGLHLRPLMNRLKQGAPVDNPLLTEVKEKYPAVWRIAQEAVRLVEEQWNLTFPPSEVGFIAIHFAAALERFRTKAVRLKRALVVCGQGLGTARLLAARLAAEIPELEVAGITSVFDLAGRLAKERYDLVISTVPTRDLSVPVIRVNPVPTVQEVFRLRQALNDLSKGAPHSNVKGHLPVLTDLLTPDRIALDVQASDWREAVRASGALLVNTGAAKPAYVEAMIRNVQDIGPYIVVAPGIAMPHARPEDGAEQVAISLVRLASPVPFGHQTNDPVDLVFALAAVDSDAHLTAIMQLSEYLSRADGPAGLRRAATAADVTALLNGAMEAEGRG